MIPHGKNVQTAPSPDLGLTRDRSFVRTPQQQPSQNKRRSFNHTQYDLQQQLQMRSKPAIEIYRPPNIRSDGSMHNKLNVNAPEFTVNKEMNTGGYHFLQHSKSNGNIQQKLKLDRRQFFEHTPCQDNMAILSITKRNTSKVIFAVDQTGSSGSNSLQRSKSLSCADAGLGSGCANEANDMGLFKPEIQALIDQALIDPNILNARSLMILANQIMQRAIEGRRFALPASRFCIAVVVKEKKETFLEAILNICRQWYQERDLFLGPPQKIKNSSRPRFTAFLHFLTEMFCQLKRRQLQTHGKLNAMSPACIVFLTTICLCCEDCLKPPVRSLSEIEVLFFVLTVVGKEIEIHLPAHLEDLLAMVRDAFLNSSASSNTRRTLLQLIELQACQWQLPGNTVLYYYPQT